MYYSFYTFFISQKSKIKSFPKVTPKATSKATLKLSSKPSFKANALTVSRKAGKASLYKTKVVGFKKSSLQSKRAYTRRENIAVANLLYSFKEAERFICTSHLFSSSLTSNSSSVNVKSTVNLYSFTSSLLKSISFSSLFNACRVHHVNHVNYASNVVSKTASVQKKPSSVNSFAAFFWTQITFRSLCSQYSAFTFKDFTDIKENNEEEVVLSNENATSAVSLVHLVPSRYATQFFASYSSQFKETTIRSIKGGVSKLDRFLYTWIRNSFLRAGLLSETNRSTVLRLNSLAARSSKSNRSSQSTSRYALPRKALVPGYVRRRIAGSYSLARSTAYFSGKAYVAKKVLKSLFTLTTRIRRSASCASVASRQASLSTEKARRLPFFTPKKNFSPIKKKKGKFFRKRFKGKVKKGRKLGIKTFAGKGGKGFNVRKGGKVAKWGKLPSLKKGFSRKGRKGLKARKAFIRAGNYLAGITSRTQRTTQRKVYGKVRRLLFYARRIARRKVRSTVPVSSRSASFRVHAFTLRANRRASWGASFKQKNSLKGKVKGKGHALVAVPTYTNSVRSTKKQSRTFKLIPTAHENSLHTKRLTVLKNLLSVVGNSHRSFYQINALSLTRYAFDLERRAAQKNVVNENSPKKGFNSRIKTSRRYLYSMERDRLSRFRYVAVYVQDLVRLCFISRYLKKASFLANFFAFALVKLPRNRKETTFLRFLRKLIKRFAAKRSEVIGVRIRFQGRVNRWRRTKHRLGEKGVLTFYTYSTIREYGRAQAITRKGALGIRIWISYTSDFSSTLRKARFAYSSLSTKRTQPIQPFVQSLKSLT